LIINHLPLSGFEFTNPAVGGSKVRRKRFSRKAAKNAKGRRHEGEELTGDLRSFRRGGLSSVVCRLSSVICRPWLLTFRLFE